MNKKRAQDRKSVTIHVRVDGATAKRWAAAAKRSGAASTSDFVRAKMAPSGKETAVKEPSVMRVREGLTAALMAAQTAEGNTLLVLVSPRQAERLHLALQMADGWRTGKGYSTAITDRYAELSNEA